MVLATTFVPRSMNSGKDSRETPDGLQLGVARRRERSFGSFERSFQVPENIDADKISAGFKKGVLTIMLPKSAEAQRAEKKIEIKANKFL
jgi:HSP20 family molecular chaperone IbpA